MKNKFLKGTAVLGLALTLAACGKPSTAEYEKWAKDHGWISTEDLDIATNASESLVTGKGGQIEKAQIREMSLDMLRGFPESFKMKLPGQTEAKVYFPGTDAADYPGTWNQKAVELVKVVNGETTTVNEVAVLDFADEDKFYTYNATTFEVAEVAEGTSGALTGWELYELVTTFSQREMMQIATSYLNKDGKVETGLSSIEFWIDPETMVALAYSEPGTEKVEHLKRNTDTSLVYIKQIDEMDYDARGYNYWNSWGVQINGQGKLYSLVDNANLFTENTKIFEAAKRYMITMRGLKYWTAEALKNNSTVDAQVGALVARMGTGYWIEVTPEEYVVTALWNRYITQNDAGDTTIANWSNSAFRVQAKWAETLYGKADRQVWTPDAE